MGAVAPASYMCPLDRQSACSIQLAGWRPSDSRGYKDRQSTEPKPPDRPDIQGPRSPTLQRYLKRTELAVLVLNQVVHERRRRRRWPPGVESMAPDSCVRPKAAAAVPLI